MKTIRKINKPIKFFGLTSLQFGVYMLVVAFIIIGCIFNHIHPVLIVTIIGLILFFSGLLLRKLKEEHKAGNPDYLSSLSILSATPKKIVDKHKIFNSLIKKKCQD